ncbi:hypothetical protein A2U01_0045821, partial [Trifolium medium]|nr:hypothetical protein [Trifolium medium]
MVKDSMSRFTPSSVDAPID